MNPLTLEEYNIAADRAARPVRDWHSTAAIFGLLIALVVSFHFGNAFLQPAPQNWWVVLIAPAMVLLIGVPLMLYVLRRSENRATAEPALRCPRCSRISRAHVTRCSGACSFCGHAFVALPRLEADGTLPDAANWRDARRQIQKNVLRGVAGLACVALAAVEAEQIGIPILAMPLFLIGFAGFVLSLYMSDRSNAAKQLASLMNCPDCGDGNVRRMKWLIASRRCCDCGRQLLRPIKKSSDEHQTARLRREDVRNACEQKTRNLILAIVCFAGFQIVYSIRLGWNGPKILNGFTAWRDLVVLSAVVFWLLFRSRIRYACWNCGESADSQYMVIAATGHCPGCGVSVCEDEPEPDRLLN